MGIAFASQEKIRIKKIRKIKTLKSKNFDAQAKNVFVEIQNA